MKAPAHIHGAGSRATVASSEGTKPREGAAARQGSPAASPHWTRPFIGYGYAADGDGPDDYNCWHFFRLVERVRFGRDIPALLVPQGLVAQLKAFRDRPDAFGWQKIVKPAKPASGDPVLMSHRDRPHHIGVYVDDVQGGAVLHCVEGRGSVLSTLFVLDTFAWNITGIYRPADSPTDSGA